MVLSSQRIVSTANSPRGWRAGGPAPGDARWRKVDVAPFGRMAIPWWSNACVVCMMLWGLCVALFAATASAAVSEAADEARWVAHGFSAAQRAEDRDVWPSGIVLTDLKADLLVVVLTQVPTKQRLPFGHRLNQVVDSIFSVP